MIHGMTSSASRTELQSSFCFMLNCLFVALPPSLLASMTIWYVKHHCESCSKKGLQRCSHDIL